MNIIKHLQKITKKEKDQKGFAILYAVILASFIMLLTASIFNISSKQLILASSVNDSGTALFLADAGVECALYYEFFTDGGISKPTNWPYKCFGSNNLIPVTPVGGDSTKYLIKFKNANSQNGCGEILVHLNVNRCLPDDGSGGIACLNSLGQPGTNQPTTEIISRGFNVCSDVNPIFKNPLLIERRMRAWFKS